MAEEQADDRSAVEAKAKEMGWIPKEEFRGDPERFVEADEYVRRGEELLPILRATTRRQNDELAALRNELAATKQANAELQSSVKELKDWTTEARMERAESRKVELVEAIKAAREAGDVERETNLSQELTKLNNPPPATEEPARAAPPRFTPSEALKSWVEANPWFGKDPVKTGLANGIAAALRAELGESRIPEQEFYQRVTERLAEYEPSRRNGAQKVGGSRATEGGGSGGTGGRAYNDLPPEAKAACDKQAARFVGPNKVYKDVGAWRKYYAETYFKE